MQYQTLLLGLSALTSASVLPRQIPVDEPISITNFFIESSNPSGIASYSFDASTADSGEQATCSFSESILGNDGRCPDAPPIIGTSGPAKCNVGSFEWSLTETNSPIEPPVPGFSFQLNHTLSDGTLLVGCRFIESQFACFESGSPNGGSERYEGPRDFNVTASSATRECVYA